MTVRLSSSLGFWGEEMRERLRRGLAFLRVATMLALAFMFVKGPAQAQPLGAGAKRAPSPPAAGQCIVISRETVFKDQGGVTRVFLSGPC